MSSRTVELQPLRALLDDALAALNATTGAPGVLKTAHVALLSEAPAYSVDMVAATLKECTYDGYARIPVVFGTVSHSDTGQSQLQGAAALFSPTGIVTPGVAAGCAIYDALTAGNPLAVATFSPPYTMAAPSDDLTVVPVISLPAASGGGYGSVVAVK